MLVAAAAVCVCVWHGVPITVQVKSAPIPKPASVPMARLGTKCVGDVDCPPLSDYPMVRATQTQDDAVSN